MRDLHGKNVIITGSSRGMGVRIAAAFAREGANLALVARTANDLRSVADELSRHGTRAITIPADITRANDRISLLKRAEAELGQIDVLVNNAGVAHWIPFCDQKETEILQIIETNLMAPLLLTRMVLPAMIERGYGHIVNISSGSGKRGVPYEAAYSASKTGLVEWSNALAMELEGTGVGLSVLCPIYYSTVGGFVRQGLAPPRLMGSLPPERMAQEVIKAIRRNSQEVVLGNGPLRPLLAINALSPRLGNLIVRFMGLAKLNRRLAGVDGGMPKASWNPDDSEPMDRPA